MITPMCDFLFSMTPLLLSLSESNIDATRGHMALNNTFGVSMNALLQQWRTPLRMKNWIDLTGF